MAGAWQTAAGRLFREAFEGRPEGRESTWFVEDREGIFDALASVDAARASVHPASGSPSIAAHAYHLRYILRGANAFQGRPKPEGDWESSWTKQEVAPEEWERLKEEIREEYALLAPFLESGPMPEDDPIGPLAQVPHVAYHLGALRALLRLV